MLIDSEKLIEKYYESVKDQYPDVPLKEFNIICRNPFAFLKKMMRQENMPQIRFQYFGVFLVYRKRVETSRHEEYMAKGVMRPEKYERIKRVVENKLKQTENDR